MAEAGLHPEGDRLNIPDAEVYWYPAAFSAAEAEAYYDALSTAIAWKQVDIKLYGKVIKTPRLTAWYGDPGMTYTYSGITLEPAIWTEDLLRIRERVELVAGVSFNSVLLNFYRNERDSMGWHSDDEQELGINPIIASVSFGASRMFQFKHKTRPELRAGVELTSGGMLLMQGTTQHFWKHQIPKSTRPHTGRINLTFRIVR